MADDATIEIDKYAAIDLGSNNCRLLIAQPETTRSIGQMRVLGSYSKSVRLGESLSLGGRLTPIAMSRARDALYICKQKIMMAGITKVRGVATAACRRASNADDFVNLINNQLQLPIAIITPEIEAKLAWRGCFPLSLPEAQDLLIFDIGGASTQIIYATRDEAGWQWVDWLSLDEGVITLFEKMTQQSGLGSGMVFDSQLYGDMVAKLRKPIQAFDQKNGINRKIKAQGASETAQMETAQMIGTSGTVTTLCGVIAGLERYDRIIVDGAWLERDACMQLIGDLVAMPAAKRMEIGCIGADRADLMIAGCALLEAIWGVWDFTRIRVADRGLREGILHHMMQEDGYHG
ncbi:MAG: Ppx/GppA phosphatase family protein [Alphaproteobacteria bacterium]